MRLGLIAPSSVFPTTITALFAIPELSRNE